MGRLSILPSRLTAAPGAVVHADRHAAERARDQIRRASNNLRRLYNTKRWRDLRMVILAREGWTCQQTGVLLTGPRHAPNSPVVDHIKPHRGNLVLFWDTSNLQAVAKEWHDSEKQRIEKADLAACR